MKENSKKLTPTQLHRQKASNVISAIKQNGRGFKAVYDFSKNKEFNQVMANYWETSAGRDCLQNAWNLRNSSLAALEVFENYLLVI